MALGIASAAQLGLNENTNNAVKKAAARTSEDVTTVALDTCGVVASVVAPTIQIVGHGLAVTAINITRGLTFEQFDVLTNAAEHQSYKILECAQLIDSGGKNLLGYESDAFGLSRADSSNAHRDWMDRLSDDKDVTDIYLPGTHDTMAIYGGDLAKTQRMDLESQLYAGIRFIDVRTRRLSNDLPIHHGVVYQKTNLTDVFKSIAAFLKEHPQEVLFARICTDGCTNDPGPFEHTYDEAVTQRAVVAELSLIKLQLGLTLAQCRGKLVWLDNPSLVEQDPYDPNISYNQRYEIVANFAAKSNLPSTKFKVNWASGCEYAVGLLATPFAVALRVNEKILKELDRPCKAQAMVFDFPGPGLTNKVIEWNFSS